MTWNFDRLADSMRQDRERKIQARLADAERLLDRFLEAGPPGDLGGPHHPYWQALEAARAFLAGKDGAG